MDPITALGLAATCSSLLTSIYKISSGLHSLRERFKASELAISSLLTQLSTLETSTSELRLILTGNKSAAINQRENLLNALHESLGSATTVISYISDELSNAKLELEAASGNGGGKLGRWTRTKHVFNESGLAPMKEALRDQMQAIHLLLTIAALPTESDQDDLLNDSSSMRTLKQARDDSSSLLWLRDADSAKSRRRASSIISNETDTLSRLSMVFGFDDTVLGSKPYRAAVLATWKSMKRTRPAGPAPARPQATSLLLDGEPPTKMPGQKSKTLIMTVKWDFEAERKDELQCKAGEALACCAITNHEWVVAKPISRLGGNGLVPISYLTVISRAGKPIDGHKGPEAIEELRAAGVPSTIEWKRAMEEYRTGAVPLGAHVTREAKWLAPATMGDGGRIV